MAENNITAENNTSNVVINLSVTYESTPFGFALCQEASKALVCATPKTGRSHEAGVPPGSFFINVAGENVEEMTPQAVRTKIFECDFPLQIDYRFDRQALKEIDVLRCKYFEQLYQGFRLNGIFTCLKTLPLYQTYKCQQVIGEVNFGDAVEVHWVWLQHDIVQLTYKRQLGYCVWKNHGDMYFDKEATSAPPQLIKRVTLELLDVKNENKEIITKAQDEAGYWSVIRESLDEHLPECPAVLVSLILEFSRSELTTKDVWDFSINLRNETSTTLSEILEQHSNQMVVMKLFGGFSAFLETLTYTVYESHLQQSSVSYDYLNMIVFDDVPAETVIGELNKYNIVWGISGDDLNLDYYISDKNHFGRYSHLHMISPGGAVLFNSHNAYTYSKVEKMLALYSPDIDYAQTPVPKLEESVIDVKSALPELGT